MTETSVIGLRDSFFRSRRMIARNFSPNIALNSSALLGHPGADEQADLLGRLVAQRASGEMNEDVFERELLHRDRSHMVAGGVDGFENFRNRPRTVVGRKLEA